MVAVLFRDGDHEPVIPLVDAVGNGASRSPSHIASTGSKVGVTLSLTITVSVTGEAHCPGSGVKV